MRITTGKDTRSSFSCSSWHLLISTLLVLTCALPVSALARKGHSVINDDDLLGELPQKVLVVGRISVKFDGYKGRHDEVKNNLEIGLVGEKDEREEALGKTVTDENGFFYFTGIPGDMSLNFNVKFEGLTIPNAPFSLNPSESERIRELSHVVTIPSSGKVSYSLGGSNPSQVAAFDSYLSGQKELEPWREDIAGWLEKRKATAQPKDDSSAPYQSGKKLIEKEKFEEAIPYLTQYIEFVEATLTNYLDSNGKLRTAQEFSEAQGGVLKVEDLGHYFDYAKALFYRGYAHYKERNYEKAILDLTKASQINDCAIYYNKILASAYLKSRKYQNAIDRYLKSIECNAGDVDESTYYHLGNAYRKLSIYDKSIKSFKKSLDIKSDAPYCWLNLGESYLGSGDYDAAVEALDTSIELKEDNGYSWLTRAKARFSLKDYAGAKKDLEQAIEIEPNYDRAYYWLARSLWRSGDKVQALEKADKAIAIKPGNSSNYSLRGYFHFHNKNYADALVDMDKALELKENCHGCYRYRARCHQELGNLRQALSDYEKAVELKPDNGKALNALAWFLVTADDQAYFNPEAGITYAERAVAVSGEKNPAYLDTLAAAYAALGNFELAASSQMKAVRLLESEGKTEKAADFVKIVQDYRNGQRHY